jgi:hypothetical protein
MTSRTARILATALIIALSFCRVEAVLAGGQTLKNSVGNMTQAPLDLALIPATSVTTIYRALIGSKTYSPLAKVLMSPFAFTLGTTFCSLLSLTTGGLRLLDGVASLPVGLAVLPTDKEIPLVYHRVENAPAMVDHDTRAYHVNFGIYYCQGK